MKFNSLKQLIFVGLMVVGLLLTACEADIETLVNEGDVEGLIKALKNDDWHIRKIAAQSLGKIGDTRAVEPLIKALNVEDDNDVRYYVAKALGIIGDERAVEPLIGALKDEYRAVRAGAAQALGIIGDARAVEPLIDAMNDDDFGVRNSAAEALGEIGDARAVGPLVEALKDEQVRERAAEALGIMGAEAVDPLIGVLKDSDKNVRDSAVNALVEIGAPAVESLMEAFTDEDINVNLSAEDALVNIGTPAVEPLLEKLNNENRDELARIVNVLGLISYGRVIEPLITRFGFAIPDDSTRNYAGIELIKNEIRDYYRKICAAYTSVVDGQGVEEASLYAPEISGPHPLVVLQTDGKAYWWNDALTLGWAPFSPSDVELVVVVEEKEVLAGSQIYTRSSVSYEVKGYRYRVDVRVHEARTGVILKSTTLDGSRPGFPIIVAGADPIHGAKVPFDRFLQWWTGEDNVVD